MQLLNWKSTDFWGVKMEILVVYYAYLILYFAKVIFTLFIFYSAGGRVITLTEVKKFMQNVIQIQASYLINYVKHPGRFIARIFKGVENMNFRFWKLLQFCRIFFFTKFLLKIVIVFLGKNRKDCPEIIWPMGNSPQPCCYVYHFKVALELLLEMSIFLSVLERGRMQVVPYRYKIKFIKTNNVSIPVMKDVKTEYVIEQKFESCAKRAK